MKILTKKEISLLADFGGRLHYTLTFVQDFEGNEAYRLTVHIKGVDYLVSDTRGKEKLFKAVKTARNFIADVSGAEGEAELRYKTEKISNQQ